MATDTSFLNVVTTSVALVIPAGLAISALVAHKFQAAAAARIANATTATAFVLWAIAATSALIVGGPIAGEPVRLVEGLVNVRFDIIAMIVLGLICGIGLIVSRFSRAYLEGDARQPRYYSWLLATLASVTLLVVSNNLVALLAAWISTSLCLHQLLTHFADRPQAQLVAHKKFLASRMADACVLMAIVLIWFNAGTLEIDRIADWVDGVDGLPMGAQLAAVFLAAGAMLKCAQLPVHGWLIQVMEAPTPVSALLHAGVVNLGGFLMIRMSPLMADAVAAQTLLVVVGTFTAVVAALVMATRVSVKVSLAWSTCAQMGFMLVQCGLGAYHLALLHLLAHSIYKAHSFLRSGSAVDAWRLKALTAPTGNTSMSQWVGAAVLGLACVGGLSLVFGVSFGEEPALLALLAVLGLGVTPMMVAGMTRGMGQFALTVAGAVAMMVAYFLWHAGFASLVPHGGPDPSVAQLTIVITGFVALFLVQAVLASQPHGQLARTLFSRIFSGLYIDEVFTRLTFRVWPPKGRTQALATVPATLQDSRA